MELERKLVAPFVVAVVALLPSLAYVAGYFWLCEKRIAGAGVTVIRTYPSKALSAIYSPAACVEEWLTERTVLTNP
jgi:hypothetical protein